MSLLSRLTAPGPDTVREDVLTAVGGTLRHRWYGPPGARMNVPTDLDDTPRGLWWRAFQQALDQIPDRAVLQIVAEVTRLETSRDSVRRVCAFELFVFLVDAIHWLVPADEVLDLVDGLGSDVLVAVADEAFAGPAQARAQAPAGTAGAPLVGWTPLPNKQELRRRYMRAGECPYCSYGLTLGAYQHCKQCRRPNGHGVWADPDLNRAPAVLS